MALILMTGMCSYQDRLVRHATLETISYGPFFRPIKTKSEVMDAFKKVRNTGNYLITEGANYALKDDVVEYMPFWYLLQHIENTDFLARIKSRYRTCLFVTANILSADFDLSGEVKVLNFLNMRTIFMSIGIQRRSDLNQSLQPGTLQFIEFLKRKDSYCFTRGVHAAEFLRSCGVPNVYEACCPSVFYHSENIRKSIKDLKEFSFDGSEHIWLNGYFKGREGDYDLIGTLQEKSKSVSYVLQDEVIIYDIIDDIDESAEIYSDGNGKIEIGEKARLHQAHARSPVDFLAFFTPMEWRKRSAAIDLSIGRRFHGNLIAMQAGRPAIFIAHDDRVTEMLEAASLPFIMRELWDVSPDKYALIRSFINDLNVSRLLEAYEKKRETFQKQVESILREA